MKDYDYQVIIRSASWTRRRRYSIAYIGLSFGFFSVSLLLHSLSFIFKGKMAVQEVFYPVLGFVRAEIIINCFIVFISKFCPSTEVCRRRTILRIDLSLNFVLRHRAVLLVVGLRITGRLNGPGCGGDDWMVVVAAVCSPNSCVRGGQLTVSKPLGVAMLVFQCLCKFIRLDGRRRRLTYNLSSCYNRERLVST